MGIFDNMETAKLGPERPDRFEEGEYLCTLDKCVRLNPRKGGEAFIAEMTDEEGNKRSWYQGDKDLDVAKANIKRFIFAMAGFNPNTQEGIDLAEAKLGARMGEVILAAIDPGIFNGEKVRVKVEKRTAKASQREYTHFSFYPVK